MPFDGAFAGSSIILLAVTGGIFAYNAFLNRKAAGTVTGGLFLLSLLIVLSGAVTGSGELLDERVEVLESRLVASAWAGSRIEGDFHGGFLSGTSGSLQETDHYTMMVEQEDGSFKQETVEAADVSVLYDVEGASAMRLEKVRVIREWQVSRNYLSLCETDYLLEEGWVEARLHLPKDGYDIL